MAHPRAVAVRRQNAELRLSVAVNAASARLGLAFNTPPTPAHKHPDLYAAELIESVADFIEKLTAATASAEPPPAPAPGPKLQRRIA